MLLCYSSPSWLRVPVLIREKHAGGPPSTWPLHQPASWTVHSPFLCASQTHKPCTCITLGLHYSPSNPHQESLKAQEWISPTETPQVSTLWKQLTSPSRASVHSSESHPQAMEVHPGDFPGGPVVRTLPFSLPGAGVQSLAGELKSHKPRGSAKKKRKRICLHRGGACRGSWYLCTLPGVNTAVVQGC